MKKNGFEEYSQNNSITDVEINKIIQEITFREKQFRILFEESPEAIFVEDENGIVLDANVQACKLHGMKKEELIGSNVLDLVPEEDISRVKRDYAKWFRGEIKYYKGFSKTKDRGKVPVEIRASRISYYGKKSLLLIVRDVMNEELTAKALKINEKKYRTLFEMANDSIFIIKDGVFIDCNKKTLEIFKCKREDIIGQSPDKFSPPKQYDGRDSREKALEKINEALNGTPQFFLWKHSKLNGETFDAEVSLNKISLNGEKFIMAIVRDVSEQYRSHLLLKKRNAILESIGFIAENLLKSEDMEKSLQESLEKLGRATDVSGCYIFQNSFGKNGELMVTLKYEWTASGSKAPIERNKILQFPYNALSNDLILSLSNNKVFYGKIKDFETKMKNIFQKHGILAIALVPIFTWDKWWGFIGFDDCRKEREWDFSEIEALKVGAGIIGSAIVRKEYEKKIIDSLNEKNILIKEIHHRVKNNLQIISSLLNLQSKCIDDEKSLKIFRESQSRIKSMALIHEKLYHSDDFSKIDFFSYIRTITRQLISSINSKVAVQIKCEGVFLTIEQAIPCGLILNELVTNSLKYAFPPGTYGTLFITVEETEKEIVLEIKDNGIGFPENIDFRTTETFGMQLIMILVDQLSGSIEMTVNHGTIFKITVPKKD